MKRRLATTYAILCTLLMIAGFVLVFWKAWTVGMTAAVAAVCGFALGFVFAPILHELGHYVMGKSVGFFCVYCKAFIFQVRFSEGKYRFSFASPFAADQTQMLPKSGGNMYDRASVYTLGGLIFSGGFLAIALLVATLAKSYLAWGMIPYALYLFLLNILAVEYPSGKTDGLVYQSIKKGGDEEKCMLAAMEIQGRLFEGRSFAEIDEGLYFDLPQLCEEQPLYAVLLDLRYRYYLDKGEEEKAADCLNRLARSQAYLSEEEREKVAAEFTYMHAICGNIEGAEESGKLCKKFLSGKSATAKRILAAYSLAAGKTEAIAPLKAQAEKALQYEKIAGVKKFEEKLLARIKTE